VDSTALSAQGRLKVSPRRLQEAWLTSGASPYSCSLASSAAFPSAWMAARTLWWCAWFAKEWRQK
jgi:hypothetical protein